jgi:hypothetical protein
MTNSRKASTTREAGGAQYTLTGIKMNILNENV